MADETTLLILKISIDKSWRFLLRIESEPSFSKRIWNIHILSLSSKQLRIQSQQ